MTNTARRPANQATPFHSARRLGRVVDPAKRPAAHREIARLYAWDTAKRAEREGRKPDEAHLTALIRLRELERLYQRRYRGTLLPDDDDGRDSFRIMADHIAHLGGEVEAHIIAWAAHWCPWMPQQEAEALAARIAAHPLKYKASTLGWRLRLTEIERTELKITTIRSIDCITDDQIRERRRRLDREYWGNKRQHRMLGQVIAALNLLLKADPGGLANPYHGKNPLSPHCHYTIINDAHFPTLSEYLAGLDINLDRVLMARKMSVAQMTNAGFDFGQSNSYFSTVSKVCNSAAKALFVTVARSTTGKHSPKISGGL